MTGKRSLGWIAGALMVLACSDVALGQYHAGVGRFLQRDPVGYGDGMNLYQLVGGGPTGHVDPTGLGEYKVGEDDTPNSAPLDTSTYNTQNDLTEAEGKVIITQALLVMTGGAWLNQVDAVNALGHYLVNSGTTMTFDFERMNKESTNARAHRIKEINDAFAAGEKFGKRDEWVSIVTTADVTAKPGKRTGNWGNAVGGYRTWAKAKVCEVKDGEYEMRWSFRLRDNYDWDMNNGKWLEKYGVKIVSHRDMARLHRNGLAREYEVIGTEDVIITWKKGERFGSGAVIEVPAPAAEGEEGQ